MEHQKAVVLLEQPELSKGADAPPSEPVSVGESKGSSNGGNGSCTSPGEGPRQSVYHIKWVRWKNHKTPIITQNENGPCPLLAIINVLTLRGSVKLPPTLDIITVEQLMEHLGDSILSSIPKDIPESAQLNYEQNMHDAIAILPKLQTGLDVNIRFTGVKDFEYTPECIVFDLLRIPLCHGWLLDPESPEVLAAVGNSGYNQLVERIINNKASTKTELVTEALIAESFLERTASQLTYHGLCELNSSLQEDELCVLFRNNHFITLLKHSDQLYQLVTDQGFLNESDVVWETLTNVEGDGQFADSDFVIKPPKPRILTTEQQIDQDYLVALSLQQEQEKEDKAWSDAPLCDSTRADEELAKQLQEEENQRANTQPSATNPAPAAAAAAAPQQNNRRSGSQSPSSRKDCTIL